MYFSGTAMIILTNR